MRKFTLSAAAALTSMLTILTCPAYTYASSDHDFEDKNTDTGYQLIIDDEAGRERDRQDVRDGLLNDWEYRVKWYGETAEEAKAALNDMKTAQTNPFGFV